MINIRNITDENFRQIIKLTVDESQSKFVATNVYSLAQAWVNQDLARPYAIYYDETPVGFFMLDWDESERSVGIWRFMISSEHQNKGYGRQAIYEILKLIKDANKFDFIHLEYVPENFVARSLYYSVGFIENGEMDGDEIVMVYPLTDNPKVGFTIADEDDFEELIELVDLGKERNMKIPTCFVNKENLLKSIKTNKLKRYTIMGKVIAMSYDDKIICNEEKYLDEIIKIME